MSTALAHLHQRRVGIQLCYPFSEKRLAKWKPPYLTQPKLNGERCRVVFGAVGPFMVSSEENVITSMPHISMALRKLNQQFPNLTSTNVELDGELYCHGMNFEEIHSRVSRSVNIHPDHTSIKLYLFDWIDEGMPQIERIVKLRNLFSSIIDPTMPIKLVETNVAYSLDEVLHNYDHYISEDYEGIIVRNLDASYIRRRSTFMMKFKPRKLDHYEVVGSFEEISKDGIPKGRLGALACVGSVDRQPFNVGTGFSVELRRELWRIRDRLPGMVVEIAYQNLTSKRGVPIFGSFKSLVDPRTGEKWSS